MFQISCSFSTQPAPEKCFEFLSPDGAGQIINRKHEKHPGGGEPGSEEWCVECRRVRAAGKLCCSNPREGDPQDNQHAQQGPPRHNR